MENSNQRFVQISTKSMINFVLIILLLIGLYYIRTLVFVFLTSIVLASCVEAVVKRLKTRGVGRTLSVVLIYFCILAVCGVFFYFFVPLFLEQMAQVTVLFAKYLPHTSIGTGGSDNAFSEILRNFETLASNASGGILQTAISVFGGLFNFVVLIVLSFYLSINDRAIETFIRLISPARNTEHAVGIWKRTERRLGLWFQGQLLLGLLVGILIYLGLLIFGIQYALLLAVVAAVMELIPFGIILAAIPAVAAGYTTHGGTGALEVAGLYLIVHEFDLNLIAPLVVQKVVGISSLVVILSFLIGLNLAGFWGLILAVPFAVCIMEIIDASRRRKQAAAEARLNETPAASVTVTVSDIPPSL